MRLGREKTGSSAGHKPKKPDKLMRGQKKPGPSQSEAVDLPAMAEQAPFFVDSRIELPKDAESPLDAMLKMAQNAPSPVPRLLGVAQTLFLAESSAVMQNALLDQYQDGDSIFWAVVGTLPPRRCGRLTESEHIELFATARGRSGLCAIITGLEYYAKPPYGETEPCSSRDEQQAAFKVACRTAVSLNVPLVVIIRPEAREEEACSEAVHDAIINMEEAEVPASWKIHFASWTGPSSLALKLLKKYPDSMLGFNGALSFRSANHLRELCFDVPLDRLLLESDAPNNSPAETAFPHSSWTVLMLAEIVAAQKRITSASVIQATVENAGKMYNKRVVRRPAPEGFEIVADQTGAGAAITGGSNASQNLQKKAASRPAGDTGEEDLKELSKFL